jgi:hypothetical protein
MGRIEYFMVPDRFTQDSSYKYNVCCFYLQLTYDDSDLTTDAVPASPSSFRAYEEAGFPSQVNIQRFPEVLTKTCRAIFCYLPLTKIARRYMILYMKWKQLTLHGQLQLYRNLVQRTHILRCKSCLKDMLIPSGNHLTKS